MRTKNRLMVCLFTLFIIVVSACGGGPSSPAEAGPMENGSGEEMGTLDLETLTAETESGTVEAQRADNSYVGLIEEGRVIGVAFLDEVGAGVGQDLEDGIVVHLYDGQDLAVMVGAPDGYGTATLESVELSDFEASVELTMEEDAVSGTVTFAGEEAIPFTAEAATGAGGVYWAQGSEENAEVGCDWVVLPDGRQWGCICIPPPTGNPCCYLRS